MDRNSSICVPYMIYWDQDQKQIDHDNIEDICHEPSCICLLWSLIMYVMKCSRHTRYEHELSI